MSELDDRPEFSPQFLVGIEQVDREHQKLFEIAGRVFDAFTANDAATNANIDRAIVELIDYTATHFANEEGLMAAAGYPILRAHKELHQHLLGRAQDMKMRSEIGERFVALDLNLFIYQWLGEHILESDKDFGKFMARNAFL
jgi:hemerythrin